MAAKLLTPKQLAGVQEKLKRANESIVNLNTEIVAFLKPPEGGFSQNKLKAANELREHAAREVPLRFGTVAGEIAHHLRSCLDHVTWLLSSDEYRLSNEAAIAFPICIKKPGNKDEVARYDRKIEGIQSTAARALIEQFQPYNATNPADDPLAIIHNLDRIDKHQTIVLVVALWKMDAQIPPFRTWMIGCFNVNQEPFAAPETDKLKLQFTQYIAFGELGERKRQPLIPALTQLADTLSDIVGKFSEL